MPLEQYFKKPAETLLPPDARRWKPKLRDAVVTCELVREREGLVFSPARLRLHVQRAGEPLENDEAPWDVALHDWLVEQHVRATTPANEAARFGLAFDDKFAPAELRYGDGFFNAVLVQELRRAGFGDVPATRSKLERVHENRPVQGAWMEDCAAMIEQVIQRSALDLTEKLSYPQGEAEGVLAEALACYLDERFNITNSEMLFG